MTKREAYKKYKLSLDKVNFNPDEEADDKFIDGCMALHTVQNKILNATMDAIRADMVKDMGEEKAEHVLKMAFMQSLAELVDDGAYPIWVGIAVATLFDNGCTVQAVVRAMDSVSEFMKIADREEEKKNDK